MIVSFWLILRLKMEVTRLSESLDDSWSTACRFIPEDRTLHEIAC
jgi:hypothetical protein